MSTAEMHCQELVELVTEYLEGALGADDRARFEAHLAGCAGCRAYLDGVRTTITAARELCEDDLSPAARDELLRAFRGWRDASP